jgi:hypothetical protein
MTATVSVAVPRKGRPLEAVLERLAARTGDTELADDVISTLRYEKAITKGQKREHRDVYQRLRAYSDIEDATAPEYTLFRDDRAGFPRRVVFDSVTFTTEDLHVHLVGREEPFRALRTHSFALGFDSADLVLEEVVGLTPDPLEDLAGVNERIDPHDTDVRIVTGLGDTVYHTLMATPEAIEAAPRSTLDREFVDAYAGELCISPRYERLVEAVLGTNAMADVSFTYVDDGREEEAAIADSGVGVYLTMSGSTARDHGLELGERLFPSETVLMSNAAEVDAAAERAIALFDGVEMNSELVVQ